MGARATPRPQNLRDSGCEVVVGQRPGSANYDLAVKDGFKPVSAAEAATRGDLVNLLLPDEVQGDIYTRDVLPNLKPGEPPALLARVQHPLRPGHPAAGRG